MSTSTSATVVGVFRDRALAEQAMQALYNAGFSRDQIRYAGTGPSNSFFEGIKSLFTGPVASGGDLANDLTTMGLSEEEARYYANEYNNGHSIVAVKAPSHEREAMDVMHSYGSYDYSSANTVEMPNGYAQQTYRESTQDNAATADEQAQAPQAQTPPVQTSQSQTSQPQQPATTTQEYTARYEDLQAQLQETQRQLQDAKSRLQAAKDRENQLRTARERESRYQEMHQQLQDAQSQLQATLAELRETENRIGQYNQ